MSNNLISIVLRALIVAILMSCGVADTAAASAKTSSSFWKGNTCKAQTWARNAVGCKNEVKTLWIVPCGAFCTSSSSAGAAWASAYAIRGFRRTSTWTWRDAYAGHGGLENLQSSFVATTLDTFNLSSAGTGLHEIMLTLEREASLEPGVGVLRGADDELYVGVYVDSASAWSDTLNTGAGTVWYGRLLVDTDSGQPGTIAVQGGLADPSRTSATVDMTH